LRRFLLGGCVAGLIQFRQRPDGRRIQHGSVRLELGPVARAIPAFLETVPVDDAADVGADRAALDQ
jgi:hypothetical protein